MIDHQSRSVTVVPSHLLGLYKLTSRVLGISEEQASEVLKATTGEKSPLYGDILDITLDVLSTGISESHVKVAPTKRGRLIDAFKLFEPNNPVCEGCGDIAIWENGGQWSVLPEGGLCPFCNGYVKAVKRPEHFENWVNSEMVAPNVTHDLRSVIGIRIPITEKDVKNEHPIAAGFEDAFKEHGVTLLRFLRFLRTGSHARQVDPSGQDPMKCLQALTRPADFGMYSIPVIRNWVAEAANPPATRNPLPSPAVPSAPVGKVILTDLVMRLYTSDEMRMLADGLKEHGSRELPSPPITLSALASEFTGWIERRGFDHDLYALMLEGRPSQANLINAWRDQGYRLFR